MAGSISKKKSIWSLLSGKKNGAGSMSAGAASGDDTIIDVRDVYKNFRVYFDKGGMLKERFADPGRGRYETREVLKGVSFTVRRGETVALIGRNGCGKSTTLKMLTKILYPNSGVVTVNGKVSSLIELGAGFHPDMSGRENIYINAAVLGLTREDVDQRIDSIIRFSELEEYIDNPVRTYSSGMYMRLAFSVAINVDADILLIDEILAVGDRAFQEKCINRLEELRRNGVTIVLVSHDMGQVQSVADRCIWVDEGTVREDGPTDVVCRHYEDEMNRRARERAEADAAEQARLEAEAADRAAGRLQDQPEENVGDEAEDNRPSIVKFLSGLMEGEGSSGLPLAGLFGMLLLVLCHAAQDIYGMGSGYSDIPLGTLSWGIRLSVFTILAIGRPGIPMLLMFTGFSWIREDFRGAGAKLSFYKKRLLPLLIIWEIFVLLYGGFLTLFYGVGFDVNVWIRRALFVDVSGMSHMWFARIFFLCLVALPFAGEFIQKLSFSTMKLVMVLSFVFLFLFPGLDLYGQANGATRSIPAPLGTLCYLWYLCLGGYLSFYFKRQLKGSREVALMPVLMIGTVISQLFLYERGVDYLIWYTWLLVSVMAFFAFDILTRLRLDGRWQSVAEELSACGIGVYLIHRPVQMLILRYLLSGSEGMNVLRTVALWLISALISYAAVFAVRFVFNKIKK